MDSEGRDWGRGIPDIYLLKPRGVKTLRTLRDAITPGGGVRVMPTFEPKLMSRQLPALTACLPSRIPLSERSSQVPTVEAHQLQLTLEPLSLASSPPRASLLPGVQHAHTYQHVAKAPVPEKDFPRNPRIPLPLSTSFDGENLITTPPPSHRSISCNQTKSTSMHGLLHQELCTVELCKFGQRRKMTPKKLQPRAADPSSC